LLSKASPLRFHTNLRLGAAVFAAVGLAFTAPAFAQNTDSAGTIQLHMPGQSTDIGGIHLHMPAKHRAPAKRKPAPQPPPVSNAVQQEPITYGSIAPEGMETPAQRTAAKPPQAPAIAKPAPQRIAGRPNPAPVSASLSNPASRAERRKAVKEVLAAPANSGATPESGFDASSGAIPFTFDAETPPPPPPAKTQRPQQLRASATKPRSQLASLEPAPKQTVPAVKHSDPHAGLTKKGEVVFPANSTDLSTDSSDQLKSLASNLNTALDSGAANVQIEAYGGSAGDKSSDARRLSLRRALTVRQLLIDSGIPTERIVVKALGGADDRGSSDRVDLFLRGAT
jgi:outer membrane protein OmpA-like peptidoglycan-associated protein